MQIHILRRSLEQHRQLASFAVVGTIGFGCDALLFLGLTQLAGIAVMPARVMAFVPATLVTWLLNRRMVFRTGGSAGRKRDEYFRYLVIQSIGIAINFAVFYVAVRIGLGIGSAQLVPLAMGSIAAMFFNFAGSRRFVFLSRD